MGITRKRHLDVNGIARSPGTLFGVGAGRIYRRRPAMGVVLNIATGVAMVVMIGFLVASVSTARELND